MSLRFSSLALGALAHIGLGLIPTAVVLAPTSARAQSCTYSFTNLPFGTVDLTSGNPVHTQGTFTATCTGTAGQTVRVCPTITGNGQHQMSYNLTFLQYALYTNAARTIFWGQGATTPALSVPVSGPSTPVTRTMPIYASILANQAGTAPATYTNGHSGARTSIVASYTTSTTCTSSTGGNQAPFTVTATVGKGCAADVGDLNFGSRNFLTANVDAQTNVTVRCTSGTGYNVNFGYGQNGTSVATRRMALNGQYVSYQLHWNAARTQVAGTYPTDQYRAGVGTGANEVFTLYGRVPPQATPAAGTYTDRVVMSVTY